MTRLASSLTAALVRLSAPGCNSSPVLECCVVGTQRYLSSSADSKPPGPTKVGTTSSGKDAATKQQLVAKTPDTATVDTMSSTSTNASSSPEQSFLDRLKVLYNESSGENELSLLKQHVTTASRQFDDGVRTVQTARLGLEKATTTYDDVNKRHSALLMRRDSWDADDATAFATLTAEEVEARKALAAARAALRKAEEDVSSRQVDYIDAMRRRYHEEQMWQDRWRVLGTYGTWTLIGLNSVIFLGGQFFHYRREASRLKRIEDLIRESNASRSGESVDKVISSVETSTAREDMVVSASVDQKEEVDEENEVTVAEVDSQDTGNTAAVRTEITKPDDSADSQSDGDTDMLVYNDITCPSDTESSDLVERLKRSRFARRVRNVVVSITQKARATGSKDDSKEIDGEEKAQTGSTTDAVAVVSHAIATSVEEVHWPSAALGAVASAVGILLICTVTGRR